MARMDDGFSTLITFEDDSSVQLWEKEVTPPGMSGGGPNDTTTMRNTAWRTLSPKNLKSLTPCNIVAAYDPAVYDEIITMMNANQLITVTFPDNSNIAFWGWIDEFTPNASVEGVQPTATIVLQPSNQNDSGVETAPAYAVS